MDRDTTHSPVVVSSKVDPPWFPLELKPWSPNTNSRVSFGRCVVMYCRWRFSWSNAAWIAGCAGEEVSDLWALWSASRECTISTSAVQLSLKNSSSSRWIVSESSWYTLNESMRLSGVEKTSPASSLQTGSPVCAILAFNSPIQTHCFPFRWSWNNRWSERNVEA